MSRTFYIFKINKEFTTLTKDYPFNLYKTMEQIYFLGPNEVNTAYKMFENIANTIDKKEINLKLFEEFRHNHNYTKFDNRHMINNYYTDEETELTVKNAHLVLKSTSENPSFLSNLKDNKNLFVCDFQNKDYFWLDQFEAVS